ncbi:MAG: hypothetical protein LBP83_03585 [Dysgonamonadaceae bacterium]|jgi:hypothetical protein|nr:hypothetical protein [Dysgonamonadaceae bacterium]
MPCKFKEYLFSICSILLLLSAIGYISEWCFIPYIYAVSGAGVAVYLLTTPYKGTNLRLKRLNIQQTIAAIMLPVSSYLMFEEMMEWVICLFVSALLLVYVVYVREYEEKKTDGKDNQPSK